MREPAFFEIILICAISVASFTAVSVRTLNSLLGPTPPPVKGILQSAFVTERACRGLSSPEICAAGLETVTQPCFRCDLSAENGL